MDRNSTSRVQLTRLLMSLVLTVTLAACSATASPTTAPTATPVPTAPATVAATAPPIGALLTPTSVPATPIPTDARPASTSANSTVPAPPATAAPASATMTAARGTAGPGAPEAAIMAVIERANQEQQQALTNNDPTVMQDTATGAYYNELVQGLSDLKGSGVTMIQLLDLQWGPITLQNPTTAQAATHENWRTGFSDGSVLESTDTNVYTLTLQGGTWKIQADQHPTTRLQQPPGGTPGAAPAPIASAAPGGSGQSQSRNWAGYAASGGTFTAVSASWTVPMISTTITTSADATWVGIGGVTAHDLIQAGTDATVQGGQVKYTAWVETLPQAAQTVLLSVNAGDTVSVAIAQQQDGTWQVTLKNMTQGQSYQTNLTYQSSRSSAEWIEESPSTGRRTLLPLDNFGTVTFSAASTTEDGQQRNLTQAGAQSITMYGMGRQPLAQPSAIGADGVSFTVSRTNAPASRTMPSAG